MTGKPAERLISDVLALVPRDHAGLFVLGIAGAQGSGKSTLAHALVERLRGQGVASETLSLDDLYLPRAERRELAAKVHPLFATRGVPATHDVAAGLRLIDDLAAGRAAPIMRFDKASDDRAPPERWTLVPAGCRVLVVEGWCLGARPQPDALLAQPVNALERDEDPQGLWRQAVNAHLSCEYRRLFDRIDALVFLAAPSFAVVERWRGEQEAQISGQGRAVMDVSQIAHFIQHYQRLSEWMLEIMPHHADLVVQLDEARRVV